MRILFAGTPEIAVPSLIAILESSHELCGVLTNPDRERGRGRKPSFPAVKEALLTAGIHGYDSSGSTVPVLQFEDLRSEAREAVAELKPDLLAVFAYGKIFGPGFLSLFPAGAVNVHPSLLPKHRGAAPIPSAILDGDSETGISVQRVALEMDRGDILARTLRPLDGSETTGSLTSWAAEEGARLLLDTIDRLESGTIAPEPQDERSATYSRKIEREDGLIDWNLSAVEVDRRIRAYTPWPRSWTCLDGIELLILEASPLPSSATGIRPGMVTGVDRERGILVQTGEGLVAVRRLQLKSRKPLDFISFCNGCRDLTGKVLGGEE
jgi:methionyl-tRNA formyltransferase